MITITVNNQVHELDVDPAMPLLWVLREKLQLNGTKFGCGIAQCGSCTVHIDGVPARSCLMPMQAVANKSITTIEGIKQEDGTLHMVQQIWIDEQVPQCGFCQSGQIMTAVSLLKEKPIPTDEDIDNALMGHICRCGTYGRIRKAIHRAAVELSVSPLNDVSNG